MDTLDLFDDDTDTRRVSLGLRAMVTGVSIVVEVFHEEEIRRLEKRIVRITPPG
jgi:hypothetical protein